MMTVHRAEDGAGVSDRGLSRIACGRRAKARCIAHTLTELSQDLSHGGLYSIANDSSAIAAGGSAISRRITISRGGRAKNTSATEIDRCRSCHVGINVGGGAPETGYELKVNGKRFRSNYDHSAPGEFTCWHWAIDQLDVFDELLHSSSH